MWPRFSQYSRSSVRWWLLTVICLTGAGLLYVVQVEGWSVTRPGRDLTIVVGLINLALYIWVRVVSRLQKRTQIATIGLLFTLQGAAYSMVRTDGFAGDGRVIFKWRWTPTPEERLAEFTARAGTPRALANLAESSPSDSPAFRGTDRTGVYRIPDLDLNWKDHPPRQLWRRPVGRGWSSFAVVGEFCVTQEQRDDSEAVVCYELQTGNEVWRHLDEAYFDEVTSGPGPRATPAIHDGKVFAFGATGILNCLEGADGHVVWSREIAKDEAPVLFGYASSPLLYGQHVYVTPGGKAGSLVAVDRDTGEIAWSAGMRTGSYSSPHLFPTNSEIQILVFDAMGLHGHDSATGEMRWSFLWGDNSIDRVNVCQPVIVRAPIAARADGAEAHQLLISSGYGRGCAMISVACNSPADEWSAREMWRTATLKSKFSSVVIRDGHAYGLDDGILTCISLADGMRRWKNGRYGYGQLILVNDVLLIQAESGRIVLVKAQPDQFIEVAELDALHERTWNHPVIAGRHLLVRNDGEAACYDISHSSPGPSSQ